MPALHERQRAAADTFVLPTKWATIEESFPYLRVRDLIELQFEDENGPATTLEYAVISDIEVKKGQVLIAGSWMPTIKEAIEMVFRLGGGTHWGTKFRDTVNGGELRISKIRILQRDIPLYKEKTIKYSAAIHKAQRPAVSPPLIYFYVRVMCEGLDISDINSVRYDDFIVSIDEAEDDIERVWFDDYEMEQWDYGNEMNLHLPNCKSCGGWRLGGGADNVELFEIDNKTISIFNRIGNDLDLKKWLEARKKKKYSAAIHSKQRPAVDPRTPLAEHIGHKIIIQQVHQPYNLDVNAAILSCESCKKRLYWVSQSAGHAPPRPGEEKFGKLIAWPSYGIIMDHTGHRMVVEHFQGLTYVMCKKCNMSVLVAKDPDTAYSAAVHKRQAEAAEPPKHYGRTDEKETSRIKKQILNNLNRFTPEDLVIEDGRYTMWVFTIAEGASGTHMPGEIAGFWDLDLPEDAKAKSWDEWEFAWEELERVADKEAEFLNRNLGLPGQVYFGNSEADSDYGLLYTWDAGDHPEWDIKAKKAYSAAIHDAQKKAVLPPPRVPLSKNGVEARCPFCSGGLEYAHAEEDGNGYYYEVTCKDCSWKGLEVYSLDFADFSDDDNSNIPGTPGECPGCGKALDYGTSDISSVGSLFYEASCNCGWHGREWYTMEYNNHADLEGNIIQADGKKAYSASVHKRQRDATKFPARKFTALEAEEFVEKRFGDEVGEEIGYDSRTAYTDKSHFYVDFPLLKGTPDEGVIVWIDTWELPQALWDRSTGFLFVEDKYDVCSLVPVYDGAKYSAVHKSQRDAVSPSRLPRPGDFARVMKSDDTLIKVGSEGVIEGYRDDPGACDEHGLVMFNPSPGPWWRPHSGGALISSPGGPGFYVNINKMRYVKEVTRAFQQWGAQGPGKNNAVWVDHKVGLFDIDLPDARARYSAAVHKAQREAVSSDKLAGYTTACYDCRKIWFVPIKLYNDVHRGLHGDTEVKCPDCGHEVESYQEVMNTEDWSGFPVLEYRAAVHKAQRQAVDPRPYIRASVDEVMTEWNSANYRVAKEILLCIGIPEDSMPNGSVDNNIDLDAAQWFDQPNKIKRILIDSYSRGKWDGRGPKDTKYSAALHTKQREAAKPVRYEPVFTYEEVRDILDAFRAGAEMEDIARKQNIKYDIVSDICSTHEFFKTATDEEFEAELKKHDPEFMLIIKVIETAF